MPRQYLLQKRQQSYWLGLLLLIIAASTGIIVDWFRGHELRSLQTSKSHQPLGHALKLEAQIFELQTNLGLAQTHALYALKNDPAIEAVLGTPSTAVILPNFEQSSIQQGYSQIWIQIAQLEQSLEAVQPTIDPLRRREMESTLDRVGEMLYQLEPLIAAAKRQDLNLNTFYTHTTILALIQERNSDVEYLVKLLQEQYEQDLLVQEKRNQQSWRIFGVMTILAVGFLCFYVYVLMILLDKAEQTAAEKTSFVHLMSHEIRTPLNSMIGAAELLMETALRSHQQDLSRMIKESGNALLAIINDLLDLSKLENHKLELEAKTLSIAHCLEAAFDILAANVVHKNLELTYTIDPSLPPELLGDFTRLRQVLLNLLNNAIKFTPTGQILVAVKVHSKRNVTPCPIRNIPTQLIAATYEVEFAVHDTGIGIEPQKMHRLFQPFSQVDASTSRRFGGTGLGLAISKRLCNLMEGTIWVESRGSVAGWPPQGWTAPSRSPSPSVTADPSPDAPPQTPWGTTFYFTVAMPVPIHHSQEQETDLDEGDRLLPTAVSATAAPIVSAIAAPTAAPTVAAPTPLSATAAPTLPIPDRRRNPQNPQDNPQDDAPLDGPAQSAAVSASPDAALAPSPVPLDRPTQALLLSRSTTLAQFLAQQLQFSPSQPKPQLYTVTTLSDLDNLLGQAHRFSGVFIDGRDLDLDPLGADCTRLKALWSRLEPPTAGPLLPLIWLQFGHQTFPKPQDWPMPTTVLTQPLRRSQLQSALEELREKTGTSAQPPSPKLTPVPSPSSAIPAAAPDPALLPSTPADPTAPALPTPTLTTPAALSASDPAPASLATPDTPPSDQPLDRLLTPQTPALPTLRVLLVEDVPTNQKVALRFLSVLGYQADVANNGKEALNALDAQFYDLIFMDLQMPEMDGLEATLAIRQRYNSPDRPWIVAMTAHASEQAQADCVRVGMNGFMTKPLCKAALVQAIETYAAQGGPGLDPAGNGNTGHEPGNRNGNGNGSAMVSEGSPETSQQPTPQNKIPVG
ncbi:MAG: response regulator [Prochlorothrix sp.]